jgi:hypothetical protein
VQWSGRESENQWCKCRRPRRRLSIILLLATHPPHPHRLQFRFPAAVATAANPICQLQLPRSCRICVQSPIRRLLAGDARCPRPVRPFPFPLPLLLAARIPEQGDPRKNPRSRLVAVSQLRLTCLTSKDMLVKALNCQARNSSRSRFATVLLGGVVVCVWRLLDMLYLLSHCAYVQLGYDDSAASQ